MQFNIFLITLLFLVTTFGQSGTKIQGPALIEGFTSITSAAGTTTLTVASQTKQIVTGSTTQTIVLPDATTLPLGRRFFIINKSSGTVTVNASGGGLLGTVTGDSQAEVHLRAAGSAAGTWDLLSSNAGGGTWGSISGTLSSQTDLQTALDAKQARSTLTTKGDLYVATASATVARQGVGADNTFLKADSSQTNGVIWASAAGAALAVTSKTTTYTATTSDDVILASTSGGAWTLTLYAASGNSGKILTIKKTTNDFTVLTIDGNSSETIDGQTTTTLNTQYESIRIICDGTNWHILDRKIDSSWISYTPSFTGFGTVTNIAFKYRRVGPNIEIFGGATAGTVSTSGIISMPTGLNIASGVGSVSRKLGYWTTNSATVNNMKSFNIIGNSSAGNNVNMSAEEYSAALSPLNSTDINLLIASSLNMSFYWSVEIDGWKGN